MTPAAARSMRGRLRRPPVAASRGPSTLPARRRLPRPSLPVRGLVAGCRPSAHAVCGRCSWLSVRMRRCSTVELEPRWRSESTSELGSQFPGPDWRLVEAVQVSCAGGLGEARDRLVGATRCLSSLFHFFLQIFAGSSTSLIAGCTALTSRRHHELCAFAVEHRRIPRQADASVAAACSSELSISSRA